MKAETTNLAQQDSSTRLANDAYLGMSFERINPQMVVSRDLLGKILSLFCDDIWWFPLLAFAVTDSAKFSFNTWRNKARFNADNIDFCKKVMLILMFFPYNKKKKVTRLTTMKDYMNTLRTICAYADKINTTVLDLLGDIEFLSNLLETCPAKIKTVLNSLIKNLNRLTEAERGFTLSGQTVELVKSKAKQTRIKSKQHPIIPSRILWELHQQQTDVLEDFSNNKEKIFSFINMACSNPFYGRCNSRRRESKWHARMSESLRKKHMDTSATYKEAIEKHKLEDLARRYEWKHIANVCSFLSLVQFCARCQIHMLTLMRDGEALSLKKNCLSPALGWNHEALYLVGTSTKLHGEAMAQQWITIANIEGPIKALHDINELISPYVDDLKLRDYLFISSAYLPISNAQPSPEGKIRRIWLNNKLPAIKITEEDIEELETIEPWRNWRSDRKFKIGSPWTLTSHQYRRSITVFAGQSGLISLSSMKRLLHHLTKAMSLYYSRGCSINNYLLKSLNPELAKEISDGKRHADAALYIRDIVRSQEPLLGIRGKRLAEQKASVWIHQTAEETARDVMNGTRSYTPSPMGACMLNGPCDRRAHGNFLWCAYCPNGIAKLSTIDETIMEIKFDIEELQPGTIEHRAELANLKDWEEMRAIIVAKG